MGSCPGLKGNAKALLGAMKLPFAFCIAARLNGTLASLLVFNDDKAEAYAVNLNAKFALVTFPEISCSSASDSVSKHTS